MAKTILIIFSVVINIWFANKIIDLEQFREATGYEIAKTGPSCGVYDEKIDRITVLVCLDEKPPRRHEVLYLIAGLDLFQ